MSYIQYIILMQFMIWSTCQIFQVFFVNMTNSICQCEQTLTWFISLQHCISTDLRNSSVLPDGIIRIVLSLSDLLYDDIIARMFIHLYIDRITHPAVKKSLAHR